MKRKKYNWRKYWRTFAACLLTACLLTACGGSSGGTASDSSFMANGASNLETENFGFYQESAAEAGMEGSDAPSVDESGSASSRQTSRKLIRNVDLDVETKEFDSLMDNLQKQITDLGGYVENMSVYNGSIYANYRSSRSAQLTVRIPQERLDEFLSLVTGQCNVTRRNDSEVDVTLTYVDLESHKQALLTEQERLLELLERAETVEDIITIESRLSDIRYQVESMESQLRTYDNQVNYSTVRMDVEEVQELTPVQKETVWQRISGGFAKSLKDLGDGLVDLMVWVIVNSPYLVVWAAVIALAVWLILKLRKRKREKKWGAYGQTGTAGRVGSAGQFGSASQTGAPGRNQAGSSLGLETDKKE